MFHSRHSAALLHATARAISGGSARRPAGTWPHASGALWSTGCAMSSAAPQGVTSHRTLPMLRSCFVIVVIHSAAPLPASQAAPSTALTSRDSTTSTCCAAWSCPMAPVRCNAASQPNTGWKHPLSSPLCMGGRRVRGSGDGNTSQLGATVPSPSPSTADAALPPALQCCAACFPGAPPPIASSWT